MKPTQEYLEYIAYQIRKLSILSTTQAGSGHPTSCLSAADIMAVLFFDIMQPQDHFILSKGHAAPAFYAVYTLLGCISEEELMSLRQFDSPLEGHPTPNFPYVQVATGSLGQGLSVAVGMLLAVRIGRPSIHSPLGNTRDERGETQKPLVVSEVKSVRSAPSIAAPRAFVLLGDSETTEGSIWEAAELAAFYKLSNLVAIIDVNGLGQTTRTIDSASVFKNKFESFGWQAIIINGNNLAEVKKTVENLSYADKPTCIIAQTQKGYGVPSVQNKENFHGKAFKPTELPHVLEELERFFPEASSYQFEGKNLLRSPLCELPKKQIFETIQFKMPHYAIGDTVSTRKAFGKALEYAGSLSEKIVSLDAEVNNSTYAEFFAKQYPQRFFQAFIAEQNMIGMAASNTRI
jgi:transketolase